jgi:hypothetical protein
LISNIYHEENNTQNPSNFDIELFKLNFEEFPYICIQFTQSSHASESKRIAKTRFQKFKNYLVVNEVVLSYFQFDSKILHLDETQLIQDQRSRLEGIVISLSKGCSCFQIKKVTFR